VVGQALIPPDGTLAPLLKEESYLTLGECISVTTKELPPIYGGCVVLQFKNGIHFPYCSNIQALRKYLKSHKTPHFLISNLMCQAITKLASLCNKARQRTSKINHALFQEKYVISWDPLVYGRFTQSWINLYMGWFANKNL